MSRFLYLFLFLLSGIIIAHAVPACPVPESVVQPDGSVLYVSLHGDEFMNFTTTADGYTVVFNENNYSWEYAAVDTSGALVSTSVLAHNPEERASDEVALLDKTQKYLRPALSAHSVALREAEKIEEPLMYLHGNGIYDRSKFRGLVILVEFNDAPFSRDDYYELINDMINKKNYDGYMTDNVLPSKVNCTGSVRDFYYDNSYGEFDPKFDVYGPVKIDYSQFSARQTSAAQTLVTAALKAADDSIDYKIYDLDGDRKVDMVYFIFSGGGSNFSGNDSRLIWPHASTVMSYASDGVSFARYACSTELYGRPSNKQIDGIGTICHEFSHVLGLPDLYDTDYEGTGGESVHPSKWSVMASGSYLNMSRTPCGYSLYERYALGLSSPILIDKEGSFSIDPLNESNVGYRINASVKNEYFLLENRQKTRWDEYLPGSGLLIHRVDSTDANVWENNKVNANPAHSYFTLLRANPKVSASGSVTDSDGDPFPGSGNVTEITNTTTPGMQSWAKVATPLVLKDIAVDADGVVSFDVCNEDIPVLYEDFESFDVMSGSASDVKGKFTDWSFLSGAKVDSVPDSLGLGKRAVVTVKSSEITTAAIDAEIESFSLTIINPTSASAIFRAYYSADGSASWISLKNLEGTSNPTVNAGATVSFTYNLGAVKNARFRFTQFSGDKSKQCYIDNVTFNCKPGSLGIGDIVSEVSSPMSVVVSSGELIVKAPYADGTPVSLYSLQGALVAASSFVSGNARISADIPAGVYVVKSGNAAVKVCVRY